MYKVTVYNAQTKEITEKWVEDEPVNVTPEEQPPTVEDRVQILEEALELLLSGATE